MYMLVARSASAPHMHHDHAHHGLRPLQQGGDPPAVASHTLRQRLLCFKHGMERLHLLPAMRTVKQ
jgi:hypothetical protein